MLPLASFLSCPGVKLSPEELKLREPLERAGQRFKKGSVSDFEVSPLDFFELNNAREYIYFFGTEKERAKLFTVTDVAADLQHKQDFSQSEALAAFLGKYWMCSTSSDFEGLVSLLEAEMNRDALKTLSTLESTLGELKKIPSDKLCPELQQSLSTGNYAWDLLTSLQNEWPVPAKPTPQKRAQLQAASEKLPQNSDFRKGVEKLLRTVK